MFLKCFTLKAFAKNVAKHFQNSFANLLPKTLLKNRFRGGYM